MNRMGPARSRDRVSASGRQVGRYVAEEKTMRRDEELEKELQFHIDERIADPATLIGAAITLAAVGMCAGWLPAWRASRIDPAAVLRES
jgi:ABC-type lipoprotein release transport system permease subunit